MNNKIVKYLSKISSTRDINKKQEYIQHLRVHSRIQLGGNPNGITRNDIDERFDRLNDILNKIKLYKTESTNDLTNKNAEIDNLSNELTNKNNEIASLKQELNNKIQEVQNMASQIQTLDSSQKDYNELAQQLNEKILNEQHVQNLIKNMEVEILKGKEECEKKLERYITILTELLTGDRTINPTEEEMIKIRNFEESLKKKFENIKEMQTQYEQLYNQFTASSNDIIKLQSKIANLENNNKLLSDENNDLKLSKDKFNKDLVMFEDNLKQTIGDLYGVDAVNKLFHN